MDILEFGWATRVLLRATKLAYRFRLVHVPGYSCCYEFFYPLYKRFIDGGLYHLTRRHPELFRGGHLIDAGANQGATANYLRTVLDRAYKLIAIEPEANNFRSLLGKLKLQSNCVCLPVALGARDEKSTLLTHPFHRGDHRLAKDGLFSVDGATRTPVQIRSLDSLVDELKLAPADIRFVKLDLQGGEQEALEGMQNTLAHATNLSLCVEFSSLQRGVFNKSGLSLFEYLFSRGFTSCHRISSRGRLEALSADAPCLTTGSSDLLFRKTQ